MKIQKFLDKIEHMLIFDDTIDNHSIHRFIDIFEKSLSKLEREQNEIQIQSILLITKKQRTIDSYTERIKVLSLENQLNDLKKPE